MDDVNNTMSITDNGRNTYEGTITQDKSFSGTYLGYEFSMVYVSPTGN